MKTIHIGEGSGRGSDRVGSDFLSTIAGRVGSGQRFGGSGRVGSKKSDPWTILRAHSAEGRMLCFYHFIFYFDSSLASSLALETQRFRDIASTASPTIPGCFAWSLAPHGIWLLPRYLSTSDPRLWICANIASCTDYHTLISDFALDIYIFGNLAQKSSLLGVGFAPDTRPPCTLLSGFTHESRHAPIMIHLALAINTRAPVAH